MLNVNNTNSNYNLETIIDPSPHVIREGVFGATFNKNNETLYLRMELLTEVNEKCWSQFKEMSKYIATNDSRGVLNVLVMMAGKENYPEYEDDVQKHIGFSKEEYIDFTSKAIEKKNRTQNKIVELLNHSSVGSAHMWTYFNPGEQHYIAYVTKNPNFSIQETAKTNEIYNLKNYIQTYSDILISVGSDFSEKDYMKDSFHNRGISRNPHWVFEEKYAGLSMYLHGFTGAVADKFFPEKKIMCVKPVGSMQAIIVKNLLRGDGYVENKNEKIDLVDLKVSATDPEGDMNYIKTSALTRIYNQMVGGSV